MVTFPPTTVGVKKLLLLSIQAWYATLQAIWPIILFLGLVREFFCLSCLPLRSNFPVYLVLLAAVIMVDLTAWLAICHRAYERLQGLRPSLWATLSAVFAEAHRLFASYVLLVMILSAGGLLGYILGGLVLEQIGYSSPIDSIIPAIIGFPIIYLLVLFLYVFPQISIARLPVLAAFAATAKLTYRHWFRAFAVYSAIVLSMALVIGWQSHLSVIGHHSRYLNIIIENALFLVLVPWLANFYLLMFHELQLLQGHGK